MDFDKAVSLYRQDIKPAISKVGEHAQEVSTAYKAIKKHCNIPPSIARFCFRLAEEEDTKRDVQLRALNGLLQKLGIGVIAADLVDQAQGSAGTSVIPSAQAKPRPNLVVVPAADAPVADGTETDLTDAANTVPNPIGTENPFEATPEELNKQAGRGKARKAKDDGAEPAYGSGAAAVKAMKDAGKTK
ncbi:hypothetical protein [Novosphingobium sp.]|uniref:hypothetical protein n=1 Tax=Novosphingobium sp. TaxID=1874826 RepID=UPI002FDC9131